MYYCIYLCTALSFCSSLSSSTLATPLSSVTISLTGRNKILCPKYSAITLPKDS